MTPPAVVVLGGGVAGCAAAVAAAEAGASVTLVESAQGLGGVAVAGEHRTLCGLAAIDAPTPDLLEPSLVGDWIPALATGRPVREGRVWLWPTTAATLHAGLTARVQAAGVGVLLGVTGTGIEPPGGETPGRVHLAGGPRTEALPFTTLIDASGAGVVARWIGLPWCGPGQWGAVRCWARVPRAVASTRVALLRRLCAATGTQAALAVTPAGPEEPADGAEGHWQVSLDVAPATAVAEAQVRLERAVASMGGAVMAATWQIAARDHGRPAGTLELAALFACRARGLCWAAWPREEHTARGVRWTWPAHDRHGVPEEAVRPPGGPPWWWCIGKGMAVAPEAAAALRVIGTGLAIGAAVGRRAAHDAHVVRVGAAAP